MANLLEQAINCDDGDRAARIIQDASDEVANYVFPKTWPTDREQPFRPRPTPPDTGRPPRGFTHIPASSKPPS